MINRNSKIFITGHKGLVGSAILRGLRLRGYKNLIFKNKSSLNLLDQKKVFNFLKKNKPDFIFIAAAKVGGILANNRFKAEFIFENLSIQNNLIHGAYINNIKNLIFLGSSCVYPKFSKQPIKEKYLMQGELEKTNDAYALAKIAGIKMCESYNFQYGTNYKCIMPCNTYGPNDNYNLITSHFYPALIMKMLHAKKRKKRSIEIWGNGKAKRELLYVDDLADACIYFMNKNSPNLINIGTGKDKTILNYANFLKTQINYYPSVNFDLSKPNGTKRKVLDVSIAKKLGWIAKTSLKKGTVKTIKSLSFS
jgi:GDP-L-fucose synthase